MRHVNVCIVYDLIVIYKLRLHTQGCLGINDQLGDLIV